jgi:hypothetical protein
MSLSRTLTDSSKYEERVREKHGGVRSVATKGGISFVKEIVSNSD